MANKGDVELTVRMRNEASKAIDAITATLEKFTGAQAKMSAGAKDAGSSLGALVAEASALMSKMGRNNAFEKMADDVIVANKALKSQEAALANSQGELQSYQRQMQAAASVQQRLRDQVAQSNESLKSQKVELKATETELAKMNKAVALGTGKTNLGFPTTESAAFAEGARRAAQRVEELRASITATSASNTGLKAQLATVESAYRTLSNQADRAGKVIERQSSVVAQQRNELQALSSTVNAATTAQEQLANAQAAAEQSANRVGIAQRRAATEIRTLADATLSQSKDAFAAPLASVSKLTDELLRAGPPTKAEADALRALADAANRAKAAPAELSTAISFLNRELRSQTATSQSVNAAMSNVDAAMKRTASATAALGTSTANVNNLLRANASAAAASATATNTASTADTVAKQRKDALNQALREYNDGARRSLDFTQRIRGQVLSLAAAYLGLQNAIGQIGQVITAFQSLEAAQNRLGAVFNGDQARVGQELDFLRRTADRLGISFQVLADEYGKFAVATNGTNLAGEETRKIFLAVAEAGRVNKLSLDNMQGTYLALTQMVSKGKVQSEELRRQLGDRLPGAFNIMAAALGKTTAELDKAMQNGEITSDALSKFADELNRRFGKQLESSLTSTTTAIGRFQNQIYQTRLAFANGGFIDAFTAGLNRLNQSLASPEFQSFIGKVSAGLGKLISALAVIPDHMDAIVIATSAFIGLKVAGYVGSLAVAYQKLVPQLAAASTATSVLSARAAQSRTAFLAATVATRSWGTALQLLGGPVGLAIAAITTAIGYWSTRTDNASVAMTKHQQIVDAVRNSYEKAGKGAENWAKQIQGVTGAQAVSNLAALNASYDQLTNKMRDSAGYFERIANQPMVSQEDKRTVGEIVAALDDLKSRAITLQDFKDRIDGINQSTNNKALKDYTLALLNSADEARGTGDALKTAELVVKALTGTATEAAAAMKELNGEFKKTDPITDATDKLKKYNDALNSIKEGIPGLAAEAKKNSALDKLGKQAAELTAAVGEDPLGLPEEAQKAIQNRVRAIYAEMDKALLAETPKVAQGLIDRIVRIESTGNADARNKRSTAAGLGQFVDATWIDQFTKVFPAAAAKMNEAAILQYKTGEQNRDTQLKVLENFTQENIARLVNAGQAPTAGNAYLAHFLGADGAIKVLLANPQELAKNILSADTLRSNPEVFKQNQTAGDLRTWAAKLMGGNAPILDSGLTKAETEAADAAKKKQTAYERINKELDDQINKIKLSRTEAEIANALAETGLEITSKEGQALAEKIRQSRQVADAEERVNELMTQRALLQEQIKYQQEQEGNLGAVQSLQLQLQGVNGELTTAIQQSIAMWDAIGGPNADIAKTKLMQQQATIKTSLTKPLIDVGAVIDSIGSTGTTAFLGVAQGIWDAASGTISWKDALTQIPGLFATMVAEVLLGVAKMILQQTILNGLYMIAAALGWYGPGAGAASSASSSVTMPTGGIRLPTNHSGGMPGQSGFGSYTAASVMAGLSYDTGGIGGQRALAPNEQLSVLKEDEEVLTGTDPRHRKNGGRGAAQPPVQVKVVNAIDSASVLSAALDTPAGGQAIMNYLKANQTRVRGALAM
ncbi:hypothetical protein AXY1_57 [Achromobacter phage AXY1]|nr:hypothetical protein AXY1_57 [Achromobacter phage AXY1]